MTQPTKHDIFLEDRDENQDHASASGLYEEVRRGDKVVVTDLPVNESTDVPSIFLRGTIAGATSQDKSEDPNFQVIRDARGPEGVVLTDREIAEIQTASSKRYLIDDSYKAVVDAYKFFIIGKGIGISAQDELSEVEEYLQEFKRANQWDGRDRDIIAKVLRAGEVFVRFYTKSGEKPARIPIVRLLNYWEITSIDYDESDREKPISYHRPYVDAKGNALVETIPADEILHIKFGDLDSQRGLPPFMTIIQSCEYYKDWRFNRIVFNRLKTAYYLEEIVESTPGQVSAQDAMTPDAIKTGQRGKVIKRMPKVGSKLTHNKAVTYKWLSPDVKADDAKEDGRIIRLGICAGAQVPEFILGDASNMNFASSMTAQNPFVRSVEWFQDFFKHPIEELFQRVIQYGIDGKFIPANSTETLFREKARDLRWWRRVPRTLIAQVNKLFERDVQKESQGSILREVVDGTGNLVQRKVIATKTTVDTQWPNLVTQNLLQDTQSYQIHQSMGVVSNETISQKLGYDFEEEQRKLQRESEMSADQNQDGMTDSQRQAEIDAMNDPKPDPNSSTGGGQ